MPIWRSLTMQVWYCFSLNFAGLIGSLHSVSPSFSVEIVVFFGGSAFFQGSSHFFESVEGFAVLGLHAEGGLWEKSAAVKSDFVNGTGLFCQKRARFVHNVFVVFFLVRFPHLAQRFKECFYFGVDLGLLFGFGVDFSCSQEIFKRAADTAFIAQERQIKGPPAVFVCEF